MLTTLVTSSRAAGLSVQSFALLCAEAPGVSIQFDFIEISVVFISVIDVFFFSQKVCKKKINKHLYFNKVTKYQKFNVCEMSGTLAAQ